MGSSVSLCYNSSVQVESTGNDSGIAGNIRVVEMNRGALFINGGEYLKSEDGKDIDDAKKALNQGGTVYIPSYINCGTAEYNGPETPSEDSTPIESLG